MIEGSILWHWSKHSMLKILLSTQCFWHPLSSYCCDKTSWREVMPGTWRPELRQRSWKSAAYCLVPMAYSTRFVRELRSLCRERVQSAVCWALPPQSRSCSSALPAGQSDRGLFSLQFPSSQMTLACVKLEKTNQYTVKDYLTTEAWFTLGLCILLTWSVYRLPLPVRLEPCVSLLQVWNPSSCFLFRIVLAILGLLLAKGMYLNINVLGWPGTR